MDETTGETTVMAATEPPRPLTVTKLTDAIKRRLEGDFRCVDVEGEVSGFKVYPSGHAYFTLKDAGAQISAVMFASAFASCEYRDSLKDGAKIKVRGKVSVYPPRGNYQLVVSRAKPIGDGELMRRYLELKAKFEAEGLFDPAKKRPLPFMPHRIGIVTSEAGAVIHDMCRVLTRRFPNLAVRLYPAVVQGDGAAETIVRGLDYFNTPDRCADFQADLLIVARGGGSMEDLWCFNDERVVRAVAASRIPVISAVGHETDFTLCDFAADRRAGTPSIAAEIAVPVREELAERLEALRRRLASAPMRFYELNAQKVDHLCGRLAAAPRRQVELAGQRLAHLRDRLITLPRQRIELAEQRFAFVRERLAAAPDAAVFRARTRLEAAANKLEILNPYATLERGYSLTLAPDGRVVRDAADLTAGDRIVTRFASGEAVSVVERGGAA